MLYRNRVDAGQKLVKHLRPHTHKPNTIVLALPRGGVPVAAIVADSLGLPLDILVVRKLGVPGSEETAMGAIASGGVNYLNSQTIQRLKISKQDIQTVVHREQQELARREAKYREGRPPLGLRDRTVIVVDDGLATGATMRAAMRAVKQQQPKATVVAVPVAAQETCQTLSAEANHVICAETPHPFHAVGLWYQDFPQTTDEEVRSLLQRANSSVPEPARRG